MRLNKIIVFGTSHFSQLLGTYVEQSHDCVLVAYTLSRQFIPANITTIYNKPLVPFENLESVCSKSEIKILITAGYGNLNKDRENIFRLVRDRGFEITSYVHPTAVVETQNIGPGCILLNDVMISPFVTIGEGNIFANRCMIGHHSLIGNYNFFAGGVITGGNVQINHNCFFGINCIIKNDIIVSEYTLASAASYVSCTTNAHDVILSPKCSIFPNKSDIFSEYL